MITNAGYEIGTNSKIREGTLIYPRVKIGDNFNSGHYAIIREDTVIGDNCSIGTHTEIGHHVKIGNNVRIHSSCFIPEYTVIEDNVWIGPCCVITNTIHPLCPNSKSCLQRTAVIIRNGAIIGAGSVILPGVVIGRDSIIGAGSLVTKSIDSNAVIFGHPAETHFYRSGLRCHFEKDFKPYEEKLSIPPSKEDCGDKK
jgi:acetyltransferase-like isoleucine patch superfamily enzyme